MGYWYEKYAKALLLGLLTPNTQLSKMQDERNFTELLATMEELKLYLSVIFGIISVK